MGIRRTNGEPRKAPSWKLVYLGLGCYATAIGIFLLWAIGGYRLASRLLLVAGLAIALVGLAVFLIGMGRVRQDVAKQM